MTLSSFKKTIRAVWMAGTLIFTGHSLGAPATVYCDRSDSTTVFAARDLVAALQEKGYTISGFQDVSALAAGPETFRAVLAKKGNASVESALAAENGSPVGTLKPQGYAYRITASGSRTTYWVIGADEAGVMYGGLDLGHSIRISDLGGVINSERNPYIVRRGLLYSLPLDARIPNYGASGDIFSENIEVMWDYNFWKEFLDDLARFHINVVYLWPQNPFPVLVKVPEYPLVSLNDVKRPTIPFSCDNTRGIGLTPPEMLNTAKTIKVMTIDDKIAFWQKVMEYGRQRGISFSMSTFSIHLYSMEGKYGFTKTSASTKDYFRKATQALVQTYPLLDGVGALDGEDMFDYSDDAAWTWIYDTYGRGIIDAKSAHPNRKVKFMARAMYSNDPPGAIKAFSSFPDTFNISCRWATNIYTTTTPNAWSATINAVPTDRQMWLELRNESFLEFRFGDHLFMRDFFKNMPVNRVFGTLWGSNQYAYGREFTSTEPETPRQLLTKKLWYEFMLLGRLSYDPDLPSSLFKKTLAYRFPEVNGDAIYNTWTSATSIIPLINRFHFTNIGDMDFRWYPEGCLNNSVNKITNFINSSTVDAAQIMNIKTYRTRFVSGQAMGTAATPLQTAQKLKDHADAALNGIAIMNPGNNKELRLTLGDIRAMAFLGYYYAEKILGATDKAIYDTNTTKYAAHKALAIDHIRLSAAHWRKYAEAFSRLYTPQWLSRIGSSVGVSCYVNMKQLFSTPLADIKLAGGSELDASSVPTTGGIVLQAESAARNGGATATRLGATAINFTGAANGSLEWNFNAPLAGTYLLEFRYSIDTGDVPVTLSINGAPADTTLSIWKTGGSWQAETRYVSLSAGDNKIKISMRKTGAVYVDYLNILHQISKVAIDNVIAPHLQRCFIKNGKLFATTVLASPATVTLQIFDMQGRLIRNSGGLKRTSGYTVLSIGIGGISKGSYIVRISNGTNSIFQKHINNP